MLGCLSYSNNRIDLINIGSISYVELFKLSFLGGGQGLYGGEFWVGHVPGGSPCISPDLLRAILELPADGCGGTFVATLHVLYIGLELADCVPG